MIWYHAWYCTFKTISYSARNGSAMNRLWYQRWYHGFCMISYTKTYMIIMISSYMILSWYCHIVWYHTWFWYDYIYDIIYDNVIFMIFYMISFIWYHIWYNVHDIIMILYMISKMISWFLYDIRRHNQGQVSAGRIEPWPMISYVIPGPYHDMI